jgi:hypothetical protein
LKRILGGEEEREEGQKGFYIFLELYILIKTFHENHSSPLLFSSQPKLKPNKDTGSGKLYLMNITNKGKTRMLESKVTQGISQALD